MPDFNFKPLLEYAEKNSVSLPANALESFTLYGNLLLEWNEKINLTAINAKKKDFKIKEKSAKMACILREIAV